LDIIITTEQIEIENIGLKMNNLTIDDIHKIRKEHAISTRNMSFDEYKADLHKEVKPLWDLLKSMKIDKKKRQRIIIQK